MNEVSVSRQLSCVADHRNELNQLFLGFMESNPKNQTPLSFGSCFKASIMFVRVQNLLAYYHRTKRQEDSADLRRVYGREKSNI
jgi:hypothetical protein